MIRWLKRLLGAGPAQPVRRADNRPQIPEAEMAAFVAWFSAQKKPAVALMPDAEGAIGASGSRLGGPAWLPEGEQWPVDAAGDKLEFLAQLDMADCTALDGYPARGVVQFFIGNDDVFGADFSDFKGGALLGGKRLVLMVDPAKPGALHPQPALADTGADRRADFTPFESLATREHGIALRPEPFTDRMGVNIAEAEQRLLPWYRDYKCDALFDWLDEDAQRHHTVHHTGGYPAYTQVDIRGYDAYAEFDHVLLRLTSDEHLLWGDVGECVFLIRSADLARGDFSRVVYSWDCS